MGGNAPPRPKSERITSSKAIHEQPILQGPGEKCGLVGCDKRVALVSHRSASKIAAAQKGLVRELRDRVGSDRVFHIPVWANLEGELSKEHTHRTRSFLFSALAAVVAHLFNKDRFTFFENGVVSLNLPPVAQVVGARATRSTHPQALAGFRRILSEVLGRPFDIANPFCWVTKTEVVERIAATEFGDLIRHTRSCTRVHDMTRLHPHCGECSQCIDRRFAVHASGHEHQDPAEAYKVDLFEGERPAGPDREMVLAYVRSATNVNRMSDVAFFARYGEASRVVGFFPKSADTVGSRVFDLYQRHAFAVCSVFDAAVSAHAAAFRERTLPETCLLRLVGQRAGEEIYPQPPPPAEPAIPVGPQIRMAIDELQKRVVFDQWGEIEGAGAELLIALFGPFKKAMRLDAAPENYPFTETSELCHQFCLQKETIIKRVARCRRRIETLAHKAGNQNLSIDAVIENNPWHGYRLNPDSVRIVALSELRPDE